MRASHSLLIPALAAVLGAQTACLGQPASRRALQAEITALEAERDRLRSRLDDTISREPRLAGMPEAPVCVGVPGALLRELVEKATAGFFDRVGLELRDLRVHKSGELRKVVSLGRYDLDVTITRVEARFSTGRPELRLGGDRLSLVLPVTLESGAGEAELAFRWQGSPVSRSVCTDQTIRRVVTGQILPDSYRLRGGLVLRAGEREILASPELPPLAVRVRVEPTAASWTALEKVIAERGGVCGVVLDKVDVLGTVRRIVRRGFTVRVPTEKIEPLALPVAIEPSLEVQGRRVALGVRIAGLAITEHMLWLGALVSPREAASGKD